MGRVSPFLGQVTCVMKRSKPVGLRRSYLVRVMACMGIAATCCGCGNDTTPEASGKTGKTGKTEKSGDDWPKQRAKPAELISAESFRAAAYLTRNACPRWVT